MTNISQKLQRAVQLHKAGQIQQAAQLYDEVLKVNPRHVDALQFLGMSHFQTGNLAAAIDCLRRAIAIRPDVASLRIVLGNLLRAQGEVDEAAESYLAAAQLDPGQPASHYNLGLLLRERGDLEGAVGAFQRVLQIKPHHADANNDLGLTFHDQGKLDKAAACYRRAIQAKADFAKAHNNLGSVLVALDNLLDAVASYQRALKIQPDYAEAHSNLGNALQEQGKLDEAVTSHQRALQIRPDYAEAHSNLGIALQELGKLDDAVASYQRALKTKPDYAEAHSNLGVALTEQGKLDDAVTSYQRALQIRPDYAESHSNLGAALRELGKLEEAVTSYQRALEIRPDYAEAHNNLGHAHLVRGDLEQGWPEYEWRLKNKGVHERPFHQTLWDGLSLKNRTILLHADQGLGDTLHFIRYAAAVGRLGGRVIVECQKPLYRLLSSCSGIDQLVESGSPLPNFDVHAPLASLPGIFHTTLATIPADIPYLFPDPTLVERWRIELASTSAFKVGIVWQGSPTYKSDHLRSIPLDRFGPLAKIDGVRVFSLQKGTGVEQLRDVADWLPIVDFGDTLDEASGPFMDTAAAMMNLDLVITADTVSAHLAGALGVPVWVALPLVPHWPWLLDRSDTPWYPTMRLFRQQQRGDWQDVFERIADELRDRVSAETQSL